MKTKLITCPMCNGCGKIHSPAFKNAIMDEKRAMAKQLHEQGYSYREIMAAMGYKSVGSVQNLLKNNYHE